MRAEGAAGTTRRCAPILLNRGDLAAANVVSLVNEYQAERLALPTTTAWLAEVEDLLRTSSAVALATRCECALGSAPVACVVATLARRVPSPNRPRGRSAYIDLLYTRPEHRRAGHGRRLLGAIIDQLGDLEVERVDLHVAAADNLYVEHGFIKSATPSMRRYLGV